MAKGSFVVFASANKWLSSCCSPDCSGRGGGTAGGIVPVSYVSYVMNASGKTPDETRGGIVQRVFERKGQQEKQRHCQ